MRRVLEYTGKRNLLEVWPLEMFAHGEWSSTYRRRSRLIPSPGMHYMETYNASEGFLPLADDPSRNDMLLMLDYGTFFEFRHGTQIVPRRGGVRQGLCRADHVEQRPVALRDRRHGGVHLDKPLPDPLCGRTKQYINVFGEASSTMQAGACRDVPRTGAVVSEYTVAPCYMSLHEQGAHEWLVEFDREPESLEAFAATLDEELRAVNSDYDAKRRTTLERQRLIRLEQGQVPCVDAGAGREQGSASDVNDRRVIGDVKAFAGIGGEGQA